MSSIISYKFYDQHSELKDLASQLLLGFRQEQKSIAPKFFYDEKGSELFTEITSTDEYYLTRTEIALLRRYGFEMAECIGGESLLVEYGSGSSEKIRILLDILRPKIYAPLDISRDHLHASANSIAKDFPWLEVHATCIDYTRKFHLPIELLENTVGFFPGSSIGNFDPDSAQDFLRQVRTQLGPSGSLLIGVDLKKDQQILDRAYNDAAGITAAFNLNVLRHLNRDYGANFNLEMYEHRAAYDSKLGCVQMFLRSKQNQVVTVANEQFSIRAGEEIHTENSFKYSKSQFLELSQKAGFKQNRCWIDDQGWFGLFYLY